MAAWHGFTNVKRLVHGMDAWTWLGYYTTCTGVEDLERKAKGGAVPVDLRSAEEFKAGHIPGAVHLPAAEILAEPTALERKVRESHPDAKGVTLYLSGGEDPVLFRTAAALEGRVGLAIFIFPEGISSWVDEGKPLHSTE